VKNLTTDNIVDINGDKLIISKSHKTNIPFQVKLMDVPLQDYRPLQTPTGRQAGVRQDELLVDVQEAENGDVSLLH
jgi:hypothetical protein